MSTKLYLYPPIFVLVTWPRISPAILLKRFPKLIVCNGAFRFFPAVDRDWHVKHFSLFLSMSFLTFGYQKRCLALSSAFWKAKCPPFVLESCSCSSTFCRTLVVTTNGLTLEFVPSITHFWQRTPSANSSCSNTHQNASASSPAVIAAVVYHFIQKSCLALSSVFWKAKCPPLILESCSCSSTFSHRIVGTTNCLTLEFVPSISHFRQRTLC